MTDYRRGTCLVALLLAAMTLTACAPGRSIVRGNWPDGRIESPIRGHYVPPTPPPAPARTSEEFLPAAPPATDRSAADLNRIGVLQTIHFDFDEATVRLEGIPVMEQNAAWLREHAGARIIIEGHCDERGTRVYNLALGQRRADAARDFLVSLGVQPSRIEVVSYGEELPAVEGYNEAAWAANRRAEFVIVATGNQGGF